MRLLLRIGGGLTLVLLLAIVAAVLLVDRIAASVVETGATQATGVPARVGSAHVSFVLGRFTLAGFRLGNPEGFGEGDLVELGSLRVEVPRNLLAPDVRIPELVIEGLDVAIEQRGARTNVGALLHGMESATSAHPAAEADARTLVIERLVVRDTQARVQVAGRPPITLRVPEIVLRDVGGSGTREQNVGLVVRHVLTAVLQSVARNPGLPRLMAGDLAGGLRDLARGEASRRAGETAREAIEGLGGLLRRKSQ